MIWGAKLMLASLSSSGLTNAGLICCPLGKVAVTLASVNEVNQGEIHGLPFFFFFFQAITWESVP